MDANIITLIVIFGFFGLIILNGLRSGSTRNSSPGCPPVILAAGKKTVAFSVVVHSKEEGSRDRGSTGKVWLTPTGGPFNELSTIRLETRDHETINRLEVGRGYIVKICPIKIGTNRSGGEPA